MQHGKCVENQRADTLLSAPTHPYTQKLLNSEPTGDPVPLPAEQTPLLEVDRLRVAFPIRKGILKRVVDHNVVVNNISFTLHRVKRWVWSASQDREKAPPVWRCYGLSAPKAASCLTVNRWIR